MPSAELANLPPVLAQTFAIIGLGFSMGRFGAINPKEVRGLGAFLGKVALPALLFAGMSKLDWSTVEWPFILGVLIGKTATFILVAGLTYIVYGQDRKAWHAGVFTGQEHRLGHAF